MNFHVKRRRSAAMQIIPMIDILIILLIFLVVTTTFRESRPALNVSLPKTETLATGTVAETRVPIVVDKEGRVQIADADVPPAAIADSLSAQRARNAAAKFELHFDEAAPLGTVVKIWDALAKSGIGVNDVPLRVLKPKAGAGS